MSYYAEFTMPADDWARWRGGEVALDIRGVEPGGNGWKLISLPEYEERIAVQPWGER